VSYLGHKDSLNHPDGSRQLHNINAGFTLGFLF